jgi:hypothetical protein
MRSTAIIISFLLSLPSMAQRVELPRAKFMTGDKIEYSFPSTNDDAWREISSNTQWEFQGVSNYDGYAWYRFHLFVPKQLRTNSLWKDSLRIFLGKVDDVCEVFMNGTKIGKSGSFPEDKEGYITTWSKTLEFHLDANSPFFNWGGENILSVRVYDGGGAGGIFGNVPYVNMIDLVDGVVINNKSSVQFISNTKARKNISLNNIV